MIRSTRIWRVGSIASQLGVHHTTVQRVLRQLGRRGQRAVDTGSLNYRNFNGAPETLPVDQHELIVLMAPRGVYVASASEDAWADPQGEFLSAVNAAPVYDLFGFSALGSQQFPADYVVHSASGPIRLSTRSVRLRLEAGIAAGFC